MCFTTFREYIFSSFSRVEWTKKRNRQYVPSRRFGPPTPRHRSKSQNYRVRKTPTLSHIASHIGLSPTALPLTVVFSSHIHLRSKRRLHFRLSCQQSVHSDPPTLLLDTRPISSSPIWSPDCKSCSFSVCSHFVSRGPNVLLNTQFSKHRECWSLTI